MPGTGFYSTAKIDGKWWFLTPDGKPFLSKAVTCVRSRGDRIGKTAVEPFHDNILKKFGSDHAWRQRAVRRLAEWGFNSIGAWSDPEASKIPVNGRNMPFTAVVNFGSRFVSLKQQNDQAWLAGIFPDVFDKDFSSIADETAAAACASLKNDPDLLGWFTDNELRWGPDWRGTDELLAMFMAMPQKAAGHRAAIRFLSERYREIGSFNEIWNSGAGSWEELLEKGKPEPPFVFKALWEQNQEVERTENSRDPRRAAFYADCEEFAGLLARRYGEQCRQAMKKADPNHLNLGCRFAYVPQPAVRAGIADNVDVISFNCYALDPQHAFDAYGPYDKPCLLGEFSFRGDDAGLPNARGAGPRVATQADRAGAFEKFITIALRNPCMTGYHWFQYSDQPVEGRFDGENSNYGVVNIGDEPYESLVGAMKKVNKNAEELHVKG